MHQKRFLKQIIFLLAFAFSPFFAFAQTSTTTVPKVDLSNFNTGVDYQQIVNQLINAGKQGLPSAEDIVGKTIRENLDIKTSPKNPNPHETIKVTAESYMTDLNKATISWYVNGKLAEQGIGRTAFSFKNGNSGETTRLTISITTNIGERVTKDISWTPVGVTLMWEADTYTPPFYKGKALMAAQARMRAIAIPDKTGTQDSLSAGNLVYVWKKEGEAISEASGYGKNSFSFLGPKPFDNAGVSVQVSSVNDTVKSEVRLNEIPLSNPFILFYENHPLLGSWYNRSLSSELTLNKKELSISAEPYFFSNERGTGASIVYDWSLNNKTVTNPGRMVTLRNEVGETGDSELTLSMRGLKQTFQTANRDLTIHFTAAESARPAF